MYDVNLLTVNSSHVFNSSTTSPKKIAVQGCMYYGVMASAHGPEAHSGRQTPLGQIHYVAQIRLGLLGFDYVGAKYPL
jgi:hypothetical protein